MSAGEIQRRFDRAADTFDTADFVIAATRDGLLARLEPMIIEARHVVDLGCATGSASRRLERRFRHARILAVDLSRKMLEQARTKKAWRSKSRYVQADAAALPFVNNSIDVVFANQLLPWMPDPFAAIAEVSRVLRKDGLFLFASLGPDSLMGLRHEPFADMHDVGDALVRAGLRDPVLDVDQMTVTYEHTGSLRKDLDAIGACHCVPDPIEISRLELELVYGHCWGSGEQRATSEYRVDAGRIGRRDG